MNLRLLFLPALSVFLGVVAQPAPARAACTYSYQCSNYIQGNCSAHETKETCTPDAPAHSYGAIAYGRTSRAWGSSYRWGSQAKAESVAMQTCAQHGNDCEVMVWFDRKCGAVASGEGTTAFWGLGDTVGEARADAQNKCVNGGGKGCEVQASQCSK